MVRDYEYNTKTGALDRLIGRWAATGGTFQDDLYVRDAIGNVTTVVDAETGTKECFLYDSRNRLVRAHTATSSTACATSPTAAFTGARGTDPYDLGWQFDTINRMDTKTDLMATSDGLYDYNYDNTSHPHAITTVTDTADTTRAGMSYQHNANGATTTRGNDELTYDAQQRLTKYSTVVSGNPVTIETYRYWTSNQRVERQAGTTRTVYLPGLDITIQGANTVITKQITIASTVVASKIVAGTGTGGLRWNCSNMQNSATCQATAGSGTNPTIRHYGPYGTNRGTTTLPGTDRGFLNQPEDTTGLTYLNNRYHDPQLAAFISVDPLVATTGTPYLYADGEPTTLTDASGLAPCEDDHSCPWSSRSPSCAPFCPQEFVEIASDGAVVSGVTGATVDAGDDAVDMINTLLYVAAEADGILRDVFSTTGYCGGAEVGVFGFGAGVQLCDMETPDGQGSSVSIYASVGIIGPSLSVSGTVMHATARNPNQLDGEFVCLAGSGGGGTGAVCGGLTDGGDLNGVFVVFAGWSASVGAPASLSLQFGYTWASLDEIREMGRREYQEIYQPSPEMCGGCGGLNP